MENEEINGDSGIRNPCSRIGDRQSCAGVLTLPSLQQKKFTA